MLHHPRESREDLLTNLLPVSLLSTFERLYANEVVVFNGRRASWMLLSLGGRSKCVYYTRLASYCLFRLFMAIWNFIQVLLTYDRAIFF